MNQSKFFTLNKKIVIKNFFRDFNKMSTFLKTKKYLKPILNFLIPKLL